MKNQKYGYKYKITKLFQTRWKADKYLVDKIILAFK